MSFLLKSSFFIPRFWNIETPCSCFVVVAILASMDCPRPPSYVVIAYDATKDRTVHDLTLTVTSVRVRGDILRGGDKLLVLGVLHRVPHPMGYQIKVSPDFFGTSNRAVEEEVSKKVDFYVTNLMQSAEACELQGVSIEVKITAGYPIRNVIMQETMACNATWVVLDRHLRRDFKYYFKHIPCKVAFVQDDLSVEIHRSNNTKSEAEVLEQKFFYSMSKSVPVPYFQSSRSFQHSRRYTSNSSETSRSNLGPSSVVKLQERILSLDFGTVTTQENTGSNRRDNELSAISKIIQQQQRSFRQKSSSTPILCVTCGLKTEFYIRDSMQFSFLEIQQATNHFSKDYLLGEGGYGHVYKGELKDGQLIAAKVRKEESTQGFTEFNSELFVLSFARHKNIVMLLGYCCKEKVNVLVYEYICNKSLYWHLFENTENVIDWHHRRTIAIGTAKGLRFLHEECRGGPIIHRDVRPSNILLTHDFVPMLGDFGLARWKTTDETLHTRILGTLGYLAPEYAETGIVSVRTDVYAFGIVLLQLISGQKVFDLDKEDEKQSLRQWAEPLIESLALHELVDPRIANSYDPYELYLMAKTAYLCMQRSPEMRPSMAEVLRLLEGEGNRFQNLVEQFGSQHTS